MGLKVSDLKRDKRTVVIPIRVGEDDDGVEVTEDLTITYQPSQYTPDLEDHLNTALDGKWKSKMGIEFITNLLLDWDLMETDDDGNDVVVELTEAGLRPLPNDFIGQVILGVSEDMGKKRRTSSDT